MITIEQLRSFAPEVTTSNLMTLTTALNEVLPRFGINTARRLRYFMAQASFETQGFLKWRENLNYTNPQRLVDVWPARFSMDVSDKNKAFAPNYVNNPQKLANLVYANRYGNGDEASGDGAAFIGRGPFQLTFRSNYDRCSTSLYGDQRLIADPSIVETCFVGLETACWFWNDHSLSIWADSDAFTKVTKIINGSDVTVPSRLKVLNRANAIFN